MSDPLEEGSRVASFRMGASVGAGGMGSVFLARDERLGRQVALKVLQPFLGDDREFRLRFIRESKAAAAVDHPNIIPVFEAGEYNGLLYIAMRYVCGGDVQSLLNKNRPLAAERVSAIITPGGLPPGEVDWSVTTFFPAAKQPAEPSEADNGSGASAD